MDGTPGYPYSSLQHEQTAACKFFDTGFPKKANKSGHGSVGESRNCIDDNVDTMMLMHKCAIDPDPKVEKRWFRSVMTIQFYTVLDAV